MQGGKPDALPSRRAGDSQRGTRPGSDRAVPGLPEVSSTSRPSPRVPGLLSLFHTPPSPVVLAVIDLHSAWVTAPFRGREKKVGSGERNVE